MVALLSETWSAKVTLQSKLIQSKAPNAAIVTITSQLLARHQTAEMILDTCTLCQRKSRGTFLIPHFSSQLPQQRRDSNQRQETTKFKKVAISPLVKWAQCLLRTNLPVCLKSQRKPLISRRVICLWMALSRSSPRISTVKLILMRRKPHQRVLLWMQQVWDNNLCLAQMSKW